MATKTAINNWTAEERYEFRQEAIEVLNELKERRKGKKFKLVRYPFYPSTWLEIRIG